jgi:hypothetical protein
MVRGLTAAPAARQQPTTTLPVAPAPVARRRGRVGEIVPDLDPYVLLRGVGNLCVGADSDPRYDARQLVGLLVEGLRRRD